MSDKQQNQKQQDKAPEREQASASTITSVQVEVNKDAMMKPVLRVYEHEVAILEEIHGPDNILVREDTAREEKVEITAEEEYTRLETRYGRSGQAALQKVYGNPQALGRAAGLSAARAGRTRIGKRNASADTVQSSQRGAGAD